MVKVEDAATLAGLGGAVMHKTVDDRHQVELFCESGLYSQGLANSPAAGIIVIMATTKKPSKAAAVAVIKSEVSTARTREAVMADICEVLALSESLEEACRRVPDAPHPATVLKWVEKYPDTLGQEYAHARKIGYQLLGDKIDRIAAETYSMVTVHKQDSEGNYLFNTDGAPVLSQVLVPLSADVMASKRLQVDTLKWKLSKMLPKVYGDRSTTELTGAHGGPIQLANASLKTLSDDELATMQALLAKSIGTGGV